ncbi:hypothetical protein V8E55_001134, partial [Tylopilus felleus]
LLRSFHDFLSTPHVTGNILFNSLFQNVTQLSQLKNTGELHALEDTWHGDQLKIEAPHGSIRTKHIDAVVE